MTGAITVAWLYPSQGLYGQKNLHLRVELDVDTVADVIRQAGQRMERDRIRRWYLYHWRLNGKLCTPNTVIDSKDMFLTYLPKIMSGCGRCRACRARRGHRG